MPAPITQVRLNHLVLVLTLLLLRCSVKKLPLQGCSSIRLLPWGNGLGPACFVPPISQWYMGASTVVLCVCDSKNRASWTLRRGLPCNKPPPMVALVALPLTLALGSPRADFGVQISQMLLQVGIQSHPGLGGSGPPGGQPFAAGSS